MVSKAYRVFMGWYDTIVTLCKKSILRDSRAILEDTTHQRDNHSSNGGARHTCLKIEQGAEEYTHTKWGVVVEPHPTGGW